MKIEQRHKGLVEKRTGVLKTHSIVQENVKEFGLETDVFSHRNVLDQNLHVRIVVADGGEPTVEVIQSGTIFKKACKNERVHRRAIFLLH